MFIDIILHDRWQISLTYNIDTLTCINYFGYILYYYSIYFLCHVSAGQFSKMEVLASIRVSALYKGNTPWRLGQVRVFCENSKWKIAVKFACHKKDYLVLAVSRKIQFFITLLFVA